MVLKDLLVIESGMLLVDESFGGASMLSHIGATCVEVTHNSVEIIHSEIFSGRNWSCTASIVQQSIKFGLNGIGCGF